MQDAELMRPQAAPWPQPFSDDHAFVSTSAVDAFLGHSRAARQVRAQLAAFATTQANVLLLGDSGSGKDVAARAIHAASQRRERSFVALDCGAIAESLVDAELFGFVRGAFTDAAAARPGLFDEADGGTLFLDELGSASPAMQARLLRVLETREVRPVGCNRPHRVDVRIIAATNRDLHADAAAGRFRKDLLFRLDVLRIQLPSLDQRPEDIPLLARHLLAELSARSGQSHDLTTEAEGALRARTWPGGVRELRNALEFAAAMAAGRSIGVEHLPTPSPTRMPATSPLSWDAWLATAERSWLLARLQENNWNRTRTAHQIGMSRQSLHERLRRHGLRPVLVGPQPDEVNEG